MPGIKGMTSNTPGQRAARNKIWQSMRILRRFTISDLCRTAGAARDNVRKFTKRLEIHGYVAQDGGYTKGRAGEYRALRLCQDTGPQYPMRCERCGRCLGDGCILEEPHEP